MSSNEHKSIHLLTFPQVRVIIQASFQPRLSFIAGTLAIGAADILYFITVLIVVGFGSLPALHNSSLLRPVAALYSAVSYYCFFLAAKTSPQKGTFTPKSTFWTSEVAKSIHTCICKHVLPPHDGFPFARMQLDLNPALSILSCSPCT